MQGSPGLQGEPVSVRPAPRGKIVFEGDGKAEMGLVWVWGIGKPGSRIIGIVSEGNGGALSGGLEGCVWG